MQNPTERQITIDIDMLIAIVGAIAGLEVTVWLILINSRLQAIFTILVFIACVAYLISKKRIRYMYSSELVAEHRQKRSVYLILNISFFALVFSALMSVGLRPEVYTRPTVYFFCVALASAVLGVEIFLLPPSKAHAFLALVKIIILTLILILTCEAIYPSLLGMDPFAHAGITEDIVSNGHLAEATGGSYSSSDVVYASFPAMHLLTASTMLVTDLHYKLATMASTCFVYIVVSLAFMFLLGRLVYSAKVGLLAALLLGFAAFYIHFGWWMVPNGFGAMLALPIMYLVFSARAERSPGRMVAAVMMMGVLILAHTIAALSFGMVLVVLWLAHWFYTRVYRVNQRMPVTLTLSILFIAAMFAWWAYESPFAVDTITKLWEKGIDDPTIFSGPVDASRDYMESVTMSEYLLRNISYPLLWALSFVGCLAACSRRFGNEYLFVLAIGGLFLLAMGFFGTPLKLAIIPERWQFVSLFFLSLPGAFGLLFLLHSLLAGDSLRILLLSLLVVALSFICIISPIANIDNPVLARTTTVRYAFETSELQAGTTISSLWGSDVSTDPYYYVPEYFTTDKAGTQALTDNFLTDTDGDGVPDGDFSDLQGPVVIRAEVVTGAFHLPGVYKLPYNPLEVIKAQGFSQIYDSDTVGAFLQKPD